jgi:hypothetical protein
MALGAVCLFAPAAAHCQPAANTPVPLRSVQIQSPRTGSLAGRLTDMHSTPLAGFSVVLRDQVTGITVHAITAKNGAFHFASLEAGDYTLEAVSAQLGHGRLEGIRVAGGAESRLRAALRLEPAAPAGTDTSAAVQNSATHEALAPPPTSAATATPLAPGLSRTTESSPASLPVPPLAEPEPALTASIAAETPRSMHLSAAPIAELADSRTQRANPALNPLRSEAAFPVPQPTQEILRSERAALETQSVIPQALLAWPCRKGCLSPPPSHPINFPSQPPQNGPIPSAGPSTRR